MNKNNSSIFHRVVNIFRTTTLSKQELIIIFVCSLILAVLIQFPSYFTYYEIDDEATFILIGQSILNGHLPYTELWDVKPPLAFAFFALAIAVFGKTIASVRFAGTICIALAAMTIYIAGKKIWNFRIGLISGVLLTIITALGSSPGELIGSLALSSITIVPLAASFAIISTQRLSPKVCFCAGIFIGIAAMVRLNIAYVGLFVGVTITILSLIYLRRSIVFTFKCGLAFAVGCLIVIFATYIPYLVSGNQKIWWDTVILAPLNYSSTSLSVFGALGAQLRYLILALSRLSSFSINLVVWVGGFSGLVLLFFQWKNLLKPQKYAVIFLVIFLISTEISILKGGKSFGHYHIQIYPFLALIAAVFWEFLFTRIFKYYLISIISSLLILFLSISPLITGEYSNLFSRVASKNSLFTGVPLQVLTYLKQDHYSGESIVLFRCHILYWILDSKPVSKSIVHPSNILNPNLLPYVAGKGATTESETIKIIQQNPKYIVYKNGHLEGTAGQIFNTALKQKYNLIHKINNIGIYKLK